MNALEHFLAFADFQLFLYFLALFVVSFCIYFLGQFLLSFFSKSFSSLNLICFQSIKKPMSLFLVFNSWAYAFSSIGVLKISFLASAANFLVIVSFIFVIYNFLNSVELILKSIFTRQGREESFGHIYPYINSFLKLSVVLLGILFLLQKGGVNITSVLAGLGLGGLAVALAAKPTVENFFGALTVLFDSPFKKGDWVHFESTEGTVLEVGFRSTKIKTFYDSIISVPNSVISNAVIDNLGKRKSRRTRFNLGVTYSTSSDQILKFVEGVRSILKHTEKVKQDYYQVYFNGYGDSSLNIFVNFFLNVSDWEEELKERQDILCKILNLAKELSIDFAFPSQSLYFETPLKKD